MTAIRTQVENGVIELLQTLAASAEGGYLNAIEPYAGDLTPGREEHDFQRATEGRMPAVLVTTGAGTYENRTIGHRIADLVFSVDLLVASGNIRSPAARQRGDGTSNDPGIYQMLEDIRARLWNRPLPDVVGACTMRPISDDVVLQAQDRTIWVFTWEIRTDAVAPPLSDEVGAYTGIDATVNFPSTDPGAPINPVLSLNNETTP